LKSTDSEASGAAPAVDFTQLQSACDGDIAMMRELMGLYFRQADEILAGLEKAITGNNVAEVNHLSHKLAGSSLACGIRSIVPSLRRMEGGAKSGHLIGAPALLADVNSEMKTIRSHVEDYLLRYQSNSKTE
jgi:HPt (histidine-containing phosphotransfer) domain-containing protein